MAAGGSASEKVRGDNPRDRLPQVTCGSPVLSCSWHVAEPGRSRWPLRDFQLGLHKGAVRGLRGSGRVCMCDSSGDVHAFASVWGTVPGPGYLCCEGLCSWSAAGAGLAGLSCCWACPQGHQPLDPTCGSSGWLCGGQQEAGLVCVRHRLATGPWVFAKRLWERSHRHGNFQEGAPLVLFRQSARLWPGPELDLSQSSQGQAGPAVFSEGADPQPDRQARAWGEVTCEYPQSPRGSPQGVPPRVHCSLP